MYGPPDLIREFQAEAIEAIEQIEIDLVELERTPDDPDLLARVFRCVHNIKGSSGFLDLPRIEGIAHAAEHLLEQLREGALKFTQEIATQLLHTVDAFKVILHSLKTAGTEPEKDFCDLVSALEQLNSPPTHGGRVAENHGSIPGIGPARRKQLEEALGVSSPADLRAAAQLGRISRLPGLGVRIEQAIIEATEHLSTTKKKDNGSTAVTSSHDFDSRMHEASVRVDVELLDQLMNQVGELVLTRNQIAQQIDALDHPGLNTTAQRLNHLTTELQQGIMKTRMQPIERVWSSLPRIARDLASECSKQITMELDGRDTELDRSLIEAIKDPMTHIVRNAIDHGIETPEVRELAGKAPVGLIRLSARHEGGHVSIVITDDGGGIDLSAVRARAISQGLVTASQAHDLSERALQHLIFEPGFSTSTMVTNVSGRGVGMDVVKTNIERINGTVDIQSIRGRGTTITIKVPLTLAIVPALMVRVCERRYAIPQVNLLELVRIDEDNAHQITSINQAPVLRLRGELLPVISLRRELQLSDLGGELRGTIVVLQVADQRFGVQVDQVDDSHEIVIKPLDYGVTEENVFAGATILGDGDLALILDVLGLAARTQLLTDRTHGFVNRMAEENETPHRAHQHDQLLITEIGDGRRLAIRLDRVTRLERLSADSVERTVSGHVVQYRGRIMPLIGLDAAISGRDGRTTELPGPDMHVVVHGTGNRAVGLIVTRIHDIVDDAVTLQRDVQTPSTLGVAAIRGHATDVVDLAFVLNGIDGDSAFEETEQ